MIYQSKFGILLAYSMLSVHAMMPPEAREMKMRHRMRRRLESRPTVGRPQGISKRRRLPFWNKISNDKTKAKAWIKDNVFEKILQKTYTGDKIYGCDERGVELETLNTCLECLMRSKFAGTDENLENQNDEEREKMIKFIADDFEKIIREGMRSNPFEFRQNIKVWIQEARKQAFPGKKVNIKNNGNVTEGRLLKRVTCTRKVNAWVARLVQPDGSTQEKIVDEFFTMPLHFKMPLQPQEPHESYVLVFLEAAFEKIPQPQRVSPERVSYYAK